MNGYPILNRGWAKGGPIHRSSRSRPIRGDTVPFLPRIQGDHELSLIESLQAASRTNDANPFAFNSLRTNGNQADTPCRREVSEGVMATVNGYVYHFVPTTKNLVELLAVKPSQQVAQNPAPHERSGARSRWPTFEPTPEAHAG